MGRELEKDLLFFSTLYFSAFLVSSSEWSGARIARGSLI